MSVSLLQTKARAAAVTLLRGYAASADTRLQVYPGRPRSLHPPTGFVDRISERVAYFGPTNRQRVPVVQVILLHSTFDFEDTVNQRDALVDGFLDYVNANVHAMDPNTTIGVTQTEDDPSYVPEWITDSGTYYATLVTLEGLAFG